MLIDLLDDDIEFMRVRYTDGTTQCWENPEGWETPGDEIDEE